MYRRAIELLDYLEANEISISKLTSNIQKVQKGACIRFLKGLATENDLEELERISYKFCDLILVTQSKTRVTKTVNINKILHAAKNGTSQIPQGKASLQILRSVAIAENNAREAANPKRKRKRKKSSEQG